MKRLKGPNLKMPDLAVPPVLADLYYDLRDRRLLPLLALILVAIVAVPFLLAGGGEEPPPPDEGVSAAASGGVPTALSVVRATPGLRDYRKRLRGRSPADPFKQRYTGSNLKGANLGGGGGGPTSAVTSTSTVRTESSTTRTTETRRTEDGVTTTKTTTESKGASDEPGSGAPSGKAGVGEDVTLYGFAIDVKVVRAAGSGGAVERSQQVRKGLVPPAALPGEKIQVVTYMGINPKTSKPLLLVSDQVGAVFGEGKCLSGSERCQLLEVDTGVPITFVYEPTGDRYKLNVLKVEPVVTGKF